jgi:hypothetical protein
MARNPDPIESSLRASDTLLANTIERAVPGGLTFCEPYLGSTSLILKHLPWRFKVHVIDDELNQLVKMGELHRITGPGMGSLLDQFAAEQAGEQLERGSPPLGTTSIPFDCFNSSPFILELADVASAVHALLDCFAWLKIPPMFGASTEFEAAYRRVHDSLKRVLVECMPVAEFMPRFDRTYSTFFIPPDRVATFFQNPSLAAFVHDMRGSLIGALQADDASPKVAIDQAGLLALELGKFEFGGVNGTCELVQIMARA